MSRNKTASAPVALARQDKKNKALLPTKGKAEKGKAEMILNKGHKRRKNYRQN
jgi:hypothetical protein